MLKKLLFSMVVAAILAVSAFGQPSVGTTYHEVQIVDEMGEKVTDITSVSIYNAGTTTESTIYKSRNKQNTMTNPVTTASTNTTLSSGYISWWGPANYDFSITDGTNVHTNSGHRDRTPSEGRIMFPSFLTSISSTTYDDNESITLGTGADWVINAGTTGDLLTFVPASDGAVFRIGTSGTTVNADFEVYTGTGVGLLINEGTSTLGITGLTTSINASSNYATNINTGTSTGAVTIGSSTSGAWAVDGTSTGTLNADASIGITTTDASGDITVDSTAGSVIIDGGEAVADAVLIKATGTAGGIDITSLGDIDITTTGASGEDITITNTGGSIAITATEDDAAAMLIEVDGGTSEVLTIHSDQGESVTEGAASITLLSDAGGICLESNADLAKAIQLVADAGSTETIFIQSDQGTSTTEKAAAIQLLADVGSVELWSGLNAADAINIMCDGDTSSGITIFNDTGTGDESILLSSDAGGITVNAAAGSVDIEAVGGTAGDIGINAGDDMTITAAGDLTLAVTGTFSHGGTAVTNSLLDYELEAGTSETVLAADSGKIFVNTASAGATTYTLPDAAQGLWYIFVDNSATGGDDVAIDPQAGDNIDHDGNGEKITSDQDEAAASVMIFALNGTDWITLGATGTWTQE